MKKKSTLLLVAVFGITLSCSDETKIYNEDLQQLVLVENSEAKLKGSLSYSKSGVLGILEESTINQKSSANKAEEQAGDYPLTLLAQILPPTYAGRGQLTATHVDVDANYAYVSYNVPGAEYFGAIQVIDISDPYNPSVTSQLLYLNTDVNSIAYDNGFIYAVGGVDAESSVTATSNSVLARIACIAGKMNTATGITYAFQAGYNANDVFVDALNVYVTSGKQGTLTAYDKNNLLVTNEVSYPDLRSVSVDNGNIAVLDAGSGIHVLNSMFQPVKDIPISTDFGPESKKTIDFMGDKIVVSEAGKGAGIYSYASSSLLEYLPILLSPTGVSQSDINTNAVAFNEGIILMANGGAGLCLAEDKGNGNELYGIIELDGSTNFVASKGDYIFAASGMEGMYIIKLNKPAESLVARCATSPLYTGKSELKVDQGNTEEYSGAKRLKSVDVSGSLLLCGSWTVADDVDIRQDALLEMNGTFAVGSNNKKRNIIVAGGAVIRVEGTLQVYGDIILEDGATLEFMGTGSIADIFGSVKLNGSAQVTGTFDDLRNSF